MPGQVSATGQVTGQVEGVSEKPVVEVTEKMVDDTGLEPVTPGM